MSVDTRIRAGIVALAVIVCAGAALVNVPRAYLDYSSVPLLARLPQPAGYGTDTIADGYESRVVLNDVRDMYTKRRVEQTPLEAATWSKQASSPYPPAMLLSLAGLYAVGQRTGAGLYGMVVGLACAFLAMVAIYCWKTRWYVFPVMCVNAPYIARRFAEAQDGSYLVMLVVVMAALFLARRRSPAAHVLMAIGITLKLSPLYYLTNVFVMKRRLALGVLAIVIGRLSLSGLVWE